MFVFVVLAIAVGFVTVVVDVAVDAVVVDVALFTVFAVAMGVGEEVREVWREFR